MKDNLDANAGVGTDIGIGEIAGEELKSFEAGEVLAFAGNETVDAANGFAAIEKRRCDGTADESGDAGDEVFRQGCAP